MIGVRTSLPTHRLRNSIRFFVGVPHVGQGTKSFYGSLGKGAGMYTICPQILTITKQRTDKLQGQGCNFSNFVRMGLDSQDDLDELIVAADKTMLPKLKLRIIFKVIFRICSRNILRSLWRTLTCPLIVRTPT